MRVFLSWSGEPSRKAAASLKRWLPRVIQNLEPWMSAEDIEVGSRWSTEIAVQLESTDFGVVCLTPGNRSRPWINFEAGALSKSLSSARVVPLLIGLKKTDLVGPLSAFQSIEPTREEIERLVRTVNSVNAQPLTSDLLSATFDRWWPDLEAELTLIVTEIETALPALAAPREERDLLEEIVTRLRDQDRRQRELEPPPRNLNVRPPPINSSSSRNAQRVLLRRLLNDAFPGRLESVTFTKPLRGAELAVVLDIGGDLDGADVKQFSNIARQVGVTLEVTVGEDAFLIS